MKNCIFLIFAFSSLLFTSCKNYEPISFSGINNVNITSLSTKGAEATITATIKNPNKVGFNVYRSNINVSIAGMNAGEAKLTKKIKIKRKSETTYSFIIKSDFSNLGITDLPRIMAIAASNNVKIDLIGNLKVGKLFIKKSFPIDITKNVPLSGM